MRLVDCKHELAGGRLRRTAFVLPACCNAYILCGYGVGFHTLLYPTGTFTSFCALAYGHQLDASTFSSTHLTSTEFEAAKTSTTGCLGRRGGRVGGASRVSFALGWCFSVRTKETTMPVHTAGFSFMNTHTHEAGRQAGRQAAGTRIHIQ